MSPSAKDGSYFMSPAMARQHDEQGPVAQGDGDPGTDQGGKVSGSDAGYVDVADNCANCGNFVGDGEACAVVSDPVSSQGWCKLHTAGGNGEEEKDKAGVPDEGDTFMGSPRSGEEE